MARSMNKFENADFLKEYERSEDYKEKFLRYPVHQAVNNNQYELLVQMLDPKLVNEFDFWEITYVLCC